MYSSFDSFGYCSSKNSSHFESPFVFKRSSNKTRSIYSQKSTPTCPRIDFRGLITPPIHILIREWQHQEKMKKEIEENKFLKAWEAFQASKNLASSTAEPFTKIGPSTDDSKIALDHESELKWFPIIFVDDMDDMSSENPPQGSSKVQGFDHILYVRCWKKTLPEKWIRENFGEYGSIVKCISVSIKMACFVQFTSKEEADKAMEGLKDAEFEGVKLEIEKSKKDISNMTLEDFIKEEKKRKMKVKLKKHGYGDDSMPTSNPNLRPPMPLNRIRPPPAMPYDDYGYDQYYPPYMPQPPPPRFGHPPHRYGPFQHPTYPRARFQPYGHPPSGYGGGGPSYGPPVDPYGYYGPSHDPYDTYGSSYDPYGPYGPYGPQDDPYASYGRVHEHEYGEPPRGPRYPRGGHVQGPHRSKNYYDYPPGREGYEERQKPDFTRDV